MVAVKGIDGDIVSLVKKPGSNAWMLTVYHPEFDRNRGGALDAAYEAFQPTHFVPTRCQDEMGAPQVASDAFDSSLNHAIRRDSCKRGCSAGADDKPTLDATNINVNSATGARSEPAILPLC
ncbi:hypothetical protein [Propionivibrio sp.]|uniref:hypothetical protein n=1 Tax=Propionivibrio sp. TaxID=2212460 RepID=UPI003BF3CB28